MILEGHENEIHDYIKSAHKGDTVFKALQYSEAKANAYQKKGCSIGRRPTYSGAMWN